MLASGDSYEDGLAQVTQLAVPSLADWCSVDVIEPDGALGQFTSGHPDPEQERLLLELRRRYRDEKRGTEGVARVIATGEPELVTVADGQARVALAPEEQKLYDRLGPRSYMIVALKVGGRTIGALTFLSTISERRYSPADAPVIEQLANRIALVIDSARARAQAARASGLLDSLFETAPIGLAFWDCDLRCVRANAAYAAMSGHPVGGLFGRKMAELFGEEGVEREAFYRQVMDDGEPRHGVELSRPDPADPGVLRQWLASFTPVLDADGVLMGVGVVAVDVTERERLLAAERDARIRATFLARAGEILDSSLDYQTTLHNVARIAVPEIADWCSVQLVDDSGMIHQVAVAHANPDRERWAWELTERYPVAQDTPRGAPNVIRTGRHELVNDITEDMLAEAAVDDEQLRLLRELGLTASLTAPLAVRGRTLGVLILISAESGKRFEQADVELAIELGRRAGMAVENARLYTERSRIAHTLQAELLPAELPEIPGFEVAARYRAAGEMNEVGGDFFDVFQTPRGSWAAFVGDVSGKGAEAAAVTALARFTLRAAVLQPGPPSEALELLNDALLDQRARRQFATVCLACVDPSDDQAPHDRARVVLSLGGHPPPLVLRGDGKVAAHGTFGTLLGMTTDVSLADDELELSPGDTLLLYTDGLTEAGEPGSRLGQEGLEKCLADMHGKSPNEIVTALERTAVQAQRGEPRDDMALVALRFTG